MDRLWECFLGDLSFFELSFLRRLISPEEARDEESVDDDLGPWRKPNERRPEKPRKHHA